MHKTMMKMMHKMLLKKSGTELSHDGKSMLEDEPNKYIDQHNNDKIRCDPNDREKG